MQSIGVRTNISSLRAERRLSQATGELTGIFRRLNSGQRINSAADDAAGLSIASLLKSDVKVYRQALRNINDGVSVLRVAQGALSELSGITLRMSELAEQSANGTYSNRQRLALDNEARLLTNEYNRIVQSTSFNGIVLFGSQMASEGLSIQAGYGDQGVLKFTLGSSISQLFSNGTYQAGTAITTGGSQSFGVATADMNGDGITDLITNDNGASTAGIQLGNGDGTFGTRTTFATTGGGIDVAVADINEDGFLDVISAEDGTNGALGGEATSPDFITIGFGNGTGGFLSTTQVTMPGDIERISIADMNGDGNLDILAAGAASLDFRLFYGNGSGSFGSSQSFVMGGADRAREVVVADFNNDGLQDMAVATDPGPTVAIYTQQSPGNFIRNDVSTGQVAYGLTSADVNGDGRVDLLVGYSSAGQFAPLINQGTGTFSVGATVAVGGSPRSIAAADVNGDGFIDAITANQTGNSISVSLGRGDGSFGAANTVAGAASPRNLAYADINGDGAAEILTANSGGGTIGVFTATTTNLSALIQPPDLRTQISARESLTELEPLRNRIAKELGAIGAFESRLEVTFKNIQVSGENFASADSRISDSDVAYEYARLVSTRIRQQVASETLSKALRAPELALSLLQTEFS